MSMAPRALLVFTTAVFAVGSIELATASSAAAYLQSPNAGACAGVAPPAGQTGGYYWVDGSGNCTSTWVSNSEEQSMVNQVVSAGDEATQATIPSDIPSADAQSGSALWDSLKNADQSLKGSSMDSLVEVGDWPALDAMPEVALGAGVFYVGWQIGSGIASFLGIDSASNGPQGYPSGTGVYSASGAEACPLGEYPNNSQPFGQCTTANPDGFAPAGADEFVVVWHCVQNCSGAAGDTSTLYYPPGPTNGTNGQATCDNYGGGFYPAAIENVPSGATIIKGAISSSTGAGTPYEVDCWWAAWTEPLDVVSLPGPGQNTPPLSSTVTSNYSPPSEQTQKSNATTLLQSGQYDQFTTTLCHAQGSPCTNIARCTPDPLTGTITVPSILDGESVGDYQRCLTDLGLGNSVSALQHTDLDEPDGDVALVDPSPGTEVKVGTNVAIHPSPSKPDMQENEECRPTDTPSAGLPAGSAPAFQDFTGTGFVGSPYPGINPNNTPPSSTQIHLYWGVVPPGTTGGWGYRHIAARRGFGPTDEQQTMLALAGPFYYPNETTPTSWVFDYPYTVTTSGGSVVSCARRVVVEYQQDPGEPAPKDIITSFYGTPLGALP